MSDQQATQFAPVIDAHLDPVQDVTNALAAAGHPNPSFWEADLRSMFPQALDKTTSGNWRRTVVNRCLHLIITETGNKQLDAMRYLLVDQGTYDEWKTLINENVAPFLARIANAAK